jgi:hypothetical protein
MTTPTLSKPGTLIHARGREWVVLPESTENLIMARPLGGHDEEITGILPAIEMVQSASFPLPGRDDIGDFTSGKLLRDAARISTRAAAGPFRSFARIAVEPRPYQLVPLMMALRLDPVRLLIADDVGIGKTIEAALIARELLDRGEIQRLTVLCPPHLAEQWQRELAEKFHIEAELVLSSTIQRLERNLIRRSDSIFDLHPFTIVSTEFIKSTRHAEDFLRKCPEFVIVDEAHGCTLAGGPGRGRQQRFELISRVASDPQRHLVLVTATPHSGNEQAFRSLLGLLDSSFADLPLDVAPDERDPIRRRLARHLVQRRRVDIRHYLQTDTELPMRLDKEDTYIFSKEYRVLFDDIVRFLRGFVADTGGGYRRRRVRYWSALALLRCVSSSPAAAIATLRNRAAVDEAADDEIDEVGCRTVLDQDDVDDSVTVDFSPGSDSHGEAENTRSKLLAFARRMEAVGDAADTKLQGAARLVKGLLKDGFRPIVFCRFVETAGYVARHLRDALPARVRVESVTGLLPPAEREARINTLVNEGGEYVLVCTDCLAEGINLQQAFDSVLHYDLCWNPTRHEQREGRVDRFGQSRSDVRVITYYGEDNPIDGVILDVLLRKHKSIKNDLGVAVAVPGASDKIIEALLEGAIFREQAAANPAQLQFAFFDDIVAQEKQALHAEWNNARDREKASRSRYAQHSLNPASVAAELQSVRQAIGSSADVARFLRVVLQAANVPIQERNSAITVILSPGTPRALRQAIGREESFTGRFELPLQDGEVYLGRTSPIVEGLAAWTLDQALDPAARDAQAVASRLGMISTSTVSTRTTLLLVRLRFHLGAAGGSGETILCEEIVPLACTGAANAPQWLDAETSERLLDAKPERNLIPTALEQQTGLIIEALPAFRESLEAVAFERAAAQLEAHERVRQTTRISGRVTIQPVLPVDILGAYVLLPRI